MDRRKRVEGDPASAYSNLQRTVLISIVGIYYLVKLPLTGIRIRRTRGAEKPQKKKPDERSE